MTKMKRGTAKLLVAAMCLTTAISSPEADAAVKKPKLSKKSVTVNVGKTVKIKVSKAAKAKISWKSNKKKVAKVKKTGKYACKITGVKEGNAVITCKVKKGKKAYSLKCKVKVKKTQKKTPETIKTPDMTVAPATVPPSAVPTATSSPAPTDGFTPIVYKTADFESGTDGFTGRGGNETITQEENGYSGKCIKVSGRTMAWNGAKIDVADTIVQGATYQVTAYIKHDAGSDLEVKCSGQTGETYPAIASAVAKSGEWTKLEGTVDIPIGISDYIIYFEIPGSATADFYLDSVVITQISEAKEPVQLQSIYDTYKDIFGYMGTCANYVGYGNKAKQLQNPVTVSFIKNHFNSFTLENEMKPDAVLGSSAKKITVDQAKALGYVIPENYTETNVPQLNFDTLDKVLEFCQKEGIKMRAHTLMWHQQTPGWFFATNYSGSKVVTPEVMDARLEFYVRTVMTHIMDKEKELTGENGGLVYAWDVTNEYIHRSNAPSSKSWMDVYGDLELEPTYVKKAFEVAYDVLKTYNVQDKVTLFYNDYDTYFCVEDVVGLVKYINEGEEANICGGIGMQSHVDVDRPTLEEYGAAVDAFMATGLEVQVTELDVTINFDHVSTYSYKDEGQTDEDQAKFVKELMELLITKQKNRDKSVSPKGITGVTVWGLFDGCSWRDQCAPLLFGSSISDPKASFYAFLEAAAIWNNN